ncbi:tRNA pseudouridine(55) synthase TruB [Collinsella provencensis]|uniref:tRNA pseudouridine(55) synthase TruB n=1 Tax=Collinsella provencensis TaxID=1937461 RepID=UPI000C81AEB1|nr:tRNA pseudouridine(55) synthase TruB [Collinsella provencensis]
MAKRKPSELNLLLAVDKPVGITSHDVVSKVRRAVGERRVGHAGTLDPLASGVMIVGVGQATRLLGRITLDRKGYLARIAFGSETTTDDAEGEVTRTAALSENLLSPMFARQVLADYVGEQEQVPPAFSAISIDGVRSYKRARAGEDIELPARTIEVYSAELVAIDQIGETVVWTCVFEVSKGTYIRALARDIGRAAGSAAHICDLRRTSSGSITSGMCLRIEDINPQAAREHALDPVSVLGLPASELTEKELTFVMNGRAIARDREYRGTEASGAPGVALVHAGQLRAIAGCEGTALAMELVFPQGIEGVAL